MEDLVLGRGQKSKLILAGNFCIAHTGPEVPIESRGAVEFQFKAHQIDTSGCS